MTGACPHGAYVKRGVKFAGVWRDPGTFLGLEALAAVPERNIRALVDTSYFMPAVPAPIVVEVAQTAAPSQAAPQRRGGGRNR